MTSRVLITTIAVVALSVPGLAQTPQGVRGKIVALKGNGMAVLSPQGKQKVMLAKGYKIYARTNTTLGHVKTNEFVGITTVKQADGREIASEIHIFPEALRGLGEGSRMMGSKDASGKPNRMTNGTVKRFGLTKPSRMTNGKIVKETGGGVIVAYKGGSLKIDIPPSVTVTEIVPASAKQLKVGLNVFALGTKHKNGSWLAKTVMIVGAK